MKPLENRTGQNSPQKGASSRRASLLFVSLLLLAGLIMAFFIIFPDIFPKTQTLNQTLQEIDNAQSPSSQKNPTLALYRTALKKAASEIDYLRILKRAYALPQNSREQYLDLITREAIAEFPGNENLWAYRVSTLLEMGNFSAASSAAEQLESAEYLPLKGEILVRSLAQMRSALSENSKADDSSIAEVVSDSPESAATYISLARLFNDPRFIFNSAILHMVRGDKTRALSLIRELQGLEWLNSFAAGLIAYDNEAWQLAVDFFEQQRSQAAQAGQQRNVSSVMTLQLLGDSYAHLQQYDKVVEVLSEARQLVDKNFSELRESFASENQVLGASVQNLGSWQLFYNLSSAYHEMNEDLKAFEVLRQGRSAFPHSSYLLLLLNLVAPADEREYTRSILSEFVDSKTTTEPKLALALLIFDKSEGNRQKFSSKLWQLFSSFPEYNQILRYLLWYFIGLNQSDDVYLALDRYRNLVLREGEGANAVYRDFPDWAKEYMAINALLKRDFATAEDAFSSIKEPNWHTYYNMANAKIYGGDFATAVRLLRRALDSAQDLPDRVGIYYRMVVLNQISGQNYFSTQELSEIEGILRSYVRDNYQKELEDPDTADERFHAKLDSLALWYKLNGNEPLDMDLDTSLEVSAPNTDDALAVENSP